MIQTTQFANLQITQTPNLRQKLLSTQQESNIKIFSLLNQISNQSQVLSCKFTHGWIQNKFSNNLFSLFERVGLSGDMSFRILDPKKCQFKLIKQISFNVAKKSFFVKDNQFWEIVTKNQQTVTIKYSNHQNSLHSNHSETQQLNPIQKKSNENEVFNEKNAEDEPDAKGKRSGERTIQEVIMLVQQWRNFKGNNSQSMKKEKKANLLLAANEVGVSKKSLDDYYYQLRTGQRLGFDFMSHLDHKIGLLRNYIKIQLPKRKIGQKNGKHGKKLKIIENFTHLKPSSIPILEEDSKMDEIQQRVTATPSDLIFDDRVSLTLDDLFYGLQDNDLQDCIHLDDVDQSIKFIHEPMFLI